MVPTYSFFAVDKGNMTLVQFSNGINMLVDCRCSQGRPSPQQYLEQKKIRTLEFVVITHPHQDHITGLRDVCERLKPKYLWHNGRCFRPDPVYDDWSYYEKLRTGGLSYCTPVEVRAGQTATIGDSLVRVVGPRAPHLEGTADDENNNAIILSIVTGKAKVVLTGDTEKDQWHATSLIPLADASVLLASHHGREDGFSTIALGIIKPQHIVISDGEAAETDATEKYREFAPVSTTRERSIVLRPTAATSTASVR
jgi:competence protein ComEC